MRHGRSLVVVLAGLAGWGLSQAVYRFAIIPRLPEWHSVPFWWWLLEFFPLLCSVVLAGTLSRTTREAAVNGLCLVVPPVAILSASGAITGQPVGHDMWVTDVAYWLVVGIQVTVGVFAVIGIERITRGLTARRHGV